MKKVIFAFALFMVSLFPVSQAFAENPEPSSFARQFGYYVAYGDALKASFTVSPSNDITYYVERMKSDIDQMGGLLDIVIENQEYVSETEAHVTISYVCKKEGSKIEKTYTLLFIDDSWKISMATL